MGAKITIIEGNSNDKDQTRNYMVSGLPGISPVIETEKVGDTATIKITDVEGEKEVELKDGVSPTITSSKEGKVTTLTIVDATGTHTATINDGEDGATTNIIDSNHLSSETTQTYSGRIINENFAGLNNTFVEKSNIATVEFSVNIPASIVEQTYAVDFPTGFTKYNSVILSAMWSKTNDTSVASAVWQPLYNNYFVDDNIVIPQFKIELGDTFNENPSKINLTFSRASTVTSDLIRYFKVVLMKVNTDNDITDYELGDINMDGIVNQDDLTLLQNYIDGDIAFTEKQYKLADMNNDKIVNIIDYTALYNKINNNS